MKRTLFIITLILTFSSNSIAQEDSCDKKYGKATVIPDDGWCLYAKYQREKGKPSASAECRCENSKQNSSKKTEADTNQKNYIDRYNQLNDKYQSLYKQVYNLGYDDIDKKLSLLNEMKTYASGLDALQNSTSYTYHVNNQIKELERQKNQKTITLTGKSSKTSSYTSKKKGEAQEKLKEIEIAQERDRKAREREALKPENYYKTSPNSIKTGGYPLTGYQKAQQDINRVNASYDKFEKAISDFKNKSYQRYKESQKEYPTLQEQIAELNKVTDEKNRRIEETSLFFNLQSSLSDLEENITDASLEKLKGVDTGNIYLKMVQLSRKKGYPTISDYTRKENSYGFKTNNPPIYNVYHTSIAVIPISLINNHPYLYNLYLSKIRAKKRTDEFYNFDVKFIKFKDVSILNKYWNLIVKNYDTYPLLDFKLDNTKFPIQSFESYVSENIDVERDYLKKVADKKKSKADNKKKTDEIFKNSKSYKKVYFKYKPYYIVLNQNNIYGLIDEAGNVLTSNKNPFQYLGNGYFEIVKEKIKADQPIIPTRRSFLYDLNKKEYYPNALYIQDYKKHNYLLLFDSEIQKWGFINISSLSGQEISVVYPKYDKFVSFGSDSEYSPNLYVMNNGLNGVVNRLGKEIVPIKYAAIRENQIKESLAFGSIEVTHYWCRTVEDYKIAHKFDETGKYLGRWKLHKSWRYIKKLKN